MVKGCLRSIKQLFRGRKHAASKALCQPPQNGKRDLQLQQCQEVWRMDDKSFLIGLFEAQFGLPAGILANLLPTAWALLCKPLPSIRRTSAMQRLVLGQLHIWAATEQQYTHASSVTMMKKNSSLWSVVLRKRHPENNHAVSRRAYLQP